MRRIAIMTHRGQYLHLVSPEPVQLFLKGKVVETKRDGLAVARGKHVTEVKRGLINHIHRYNVYTRSTFRDLRAHMYHSCTMYICACEIPKLYMSTEVVLFRSSKSLFFVYISKVQLYRGVRDYDTRSAARLSLHEQRQMCGGLQHKNKHRKITKY